MQKILGVQFLLERKVSFLLLVFVWV